MAARWARAVGAGASVVLAAVIGIAINMVTDELSWGWGVGLVTLVLVGAGVQVWLTLADSVAGDVRASGVGSIAVGGSAQGKLSTRVNGPAGTRDGVTTPGGGVIADGLGAISVGGDADEVETDVRLGGAGDVR